MFKKLSTILLAALLLISTASFAADSGTKDQATALVKKAFEYSKTNGQDKLIEELNKNPGQFIDRDLYVFAVNKDGTRLSHPYKKDTIGKSLYDSKDIDGKAYGEELMDIATNKGEGWVEYKFTDPTTNKIADKETYVLKSGDLILLCGVYKH